MSTVVDLQHRILKNSRNYTVSSDLQAELKRSLTVAIANYGVAPVSILATITRMLLSKVNNDYDVTPEN